jgi:hypothetical protein
MTAREQLNRQMQMRWVGIAVYMGFVLFAVLAFPVQDKTGFVVMLALPGFAIFCLSILSQRGLRCPYCRGRIGLALIYPVGLSVNPTARFCQHCGHSLDEEHGCSRAD